MSERHEITRADIDPDQLRAALSTRLGRRVETVLRPASDTEPGRLTVEEPDGSVVDLDPAVVAEVLASLPVLQSEEQRLVADIDAAATVLGKVTAIRDFYARRVSESEARRRRETELLDRLSRAREIPPQ